MTEQHASDSPSPFVGSRQAAVPPGLRIYAIGDIHGRADLLAALLLNIVADANARPSATPLVVLLGDYLDRGPDSARVIELILTTRERMPLVALTGNHELYALRFLSDPGFGPRWLALGGKATLESYGLIVPPKPSARNFRDLSQTFGLAFPASHRDLLWSLPTSFGIGDYIFVHAGLEPGMALGLQSAETLTTIREPFLSSPHRLDRVIVHGHTIVSRPEIGGGRINIDTGACLTNRLTCIALEGTSLRFIEGGARDTPLGR